MHTYKVEGVGEDFWPGTFDPTLVDAWVKVSDRDSFLAARRLTREEGILIGGSGGLAVHAALEVAREVDDPEALVVVLLPDSGRGYLSKIYNDDWMRENGFLSRFTQPARVGAVVAERSGETPDGRRRRLRPDRRRRHRAAAPARHLAAAGRAHRHAAGRGDGGAARIEVQSVAGSVQERGLLDHLFRNPDALSAKISTVMDGPFPLVDANEEVERVVPMLASGAPAVLVQRDGAIIGVVTRADVLEYVAHHRGS